MNAHHPNCGATGITKTFIRGLLAILAIACFWLGTQSRSFAFPPVIQPRVPFPGATPPPIAKPELAAVQPPPPPPEPQVTQKKQDVPEPCPCTQTDASEAPAHNVQHGSPILLAASEPQPTPALTAAVRAEPTGNAPLPAPDRDKSKTKGLRVLVLGDSLALCGFGKALDSKLRTNQNVASVSTIMACGVVPASWLKTGPYANIKTPCGFWTIEGKCGTASSPVESKDIYGMTRGHKPAPHLVPKIESLFETIDPDILIMQCGTNLLSMFSDGKTLIPTRHDSQMRANLVPFRNCVSTLPRSLKRIYWVAPPVSGRYTPAIQDFLVDKLSLYGEQVWRVVDSRNLLTYPYKGLMPDKEHFVGKDMTAWAEAVYKIVSDDIGGAQISNAPLATQKIPAAPGASKAETAPSTTAGGRKILSVKATLIRKSPVLPVNQILPYQESLVSYLYRVEEVLSGTYKERDLLVMHPAHIRLQDQPLSKLRVLKSYKLDLVELDGSVWESTKKSDVVDRADLLPYILAEDEARSPLMNR